MEDQVWTWLWEYCVKFNHSDICKDVEQHLFRSNICPELKSLSLFLLVRQMQLLSQSSLHSHQELKQLIHILEDILTIKKLHFHIKFHKEIIRTYISAKMLISAGEEHKSYMKEVNNMDWNSIKKKFSYEDDDYRKSYEEGHIIAKEALENGLNSDLRHRTLKLLKEALCLLENTFRYMLPTTALENLCNGDVREYLEQQEEVPVYGILLKATHNGITKATVMSILQWLMKDHMFVGKAKNARNVTGQNKNARNSTGQNKNARNSTGQNENDYISSESGEDDRDCATNSNITSKLSRNKKSKVKSEDEVFNNINDEHIQILGRKLEVAGAPLITARRSKTTKSTSKTAKSFDTTYPSSNISFNQCQANMKANNQASVDNDDVNSSWDLIFLQGEKKTIKNANLFKVKSGIYKTKEIGRSESKNSTGSLDIHIGLSEKQYNEDSEIQDLELLIHLVGDYLNKLKKKLNILKENKIKERYNSSSTDSQNNSTDFINKPSKQPNKTTQCGNRKQHTTVNSCNKTGQLIFTENDLCTGKNKELSNNIHGEELSTRTEKQSSHIVSNESPKKHVSIKSNKSFSMNIPHSSLSIEHTGIRLSNLDEVNMEINDQIKRRNSNKPLSLEDAKRRINFNSGEKEDEEPSIHYEVESQIKTAQPSMPESITEENTEEDEESLHLEMSNSDSPRENILEKDPSNMLTIEDTEEDPLINSDKDNVFASLSTGKKVDSQFYSVQEECNDFVDNALEHIESDSHENLFFEPLIDMNRMTTVKKKRIHSDVQITKNKIDEIDSDLATSVKTSPRKRKTNIGKYEYNGSKKEAKTRSHRNKKLKATNISSPLSISESKTSRSKNDSICKSKLSSVSEEDNSSPDTEEDYFTPEGSPTKNEHHEATVSPQRLKSRLQPPTEYNTGHRNEVAVRLSKIYTKKFESVIYDIFA